MPKVQLFKRAKVFSTALTILVFGLLRLPAQGQIPLVDTSFQPDLNSDGQIYGIVVQADGRILIGGGFESVSCQRATNLARLFSNGQVDGSFGIGTDAAVYGLAEEPDGKIVVSGNFTQLKGIPCLGLGRLLTNGDVDTNFDAGMLFSATNYNGTPFRLAIRPDGKILVSTLSSRLFQLTTNGGLDSTFVQTNFFEGYWIHSLFIQTNGNVLAGGGFSSVNGFASPGLVQLDVSGQVNTNFQTGLAPNSDVFTILQQTNGGFLVGGHFIHTNGMANTILERLDSNLKWDTSFQPSPFAPYDFISGAYIRAAILQPDGKIVVGGNFDQVGGYFRRFIVRLDSAGKVDPCFDPGIGLGGNWGANVVTSQPDGRILVGGTFGVAGMVPNNLVRLLPQSDCNATRVYFGQDENLIYVAGTTPPGGTNTLQVSTNFTDWIEILTQTDSYIFLPTGIDHDYNAIFYRIKRTP